MVQQVSLSAVAKVLITLFAAVNSSINPKHHHHHRHHHRHNGSHGSGSNGSQVVPAAQSQAAQGANATATLVGTKTMVQGEQEQALPAVSEQQILQKMKTLEKMGEDMRKASVAKGHLSVNGPLPADFSERFAQSVAEATGCSAKDVVLLGAVPVPEAEVNTEEILFRAREDIVAAVEDQAADPASKLASGLLHSFLVVRESPEGDDASEQQDQDQDQEPVSMKSASRPQAKPQRESAEGGVPSSTVAREAAPEVDMAMPYGDLEPFGREDTAQELTESSVHESNAMVDQLERAEVAEEKRAVFRALTRLRGAAITSFDGIARSQTGNIDDYARANQWRQEHPVHHLAGDEADVAKWAFPSDEEQQS